MIVIFAPEVGISCGLTRLAVGPSFVKTTSVCVLTPATVTVTVCALTELGVVKTICVCVQLVATTAVESYSSRPRVAKLRIDVD